MSKIKKFLENKFQKAVPIFLFLSLTTNFTSALATIGPTLPWVNFGQRLARVINKKTDKIEQPLISVVATAYSSTPHQTDSTPFTTAANTSTRDGIVAANFLKFYTKIKIPELYGDKVFIVEDRMNRRYNDANPPRIDIWMPNTRSAKKFGIKKVKIVVLP